MKLSWVILTFNRKETVEKAVLHNLANSGRQIDELIWVDNGSTDGVRDFMKSIDPDISILNKTNLGVSKGYNRGYAMATGTHVCITGCDRIMPDDWAKTFEKYFEAIPNTGIISCYSWGLDHVPERRRRSDKSDEIINGLPITHAMPFEARILKRDLFRKIGYLHEGFGLYGHEDNHWGARAEKICDADGLLYYIIPGMKAEHLGCEGNVAYNGGDPKAYHEFKQRECKDDRKVRLLDKLRKEDWPYVNPYA